MKTITALLLITGFALVGCKKKEETVAAPPPSPAPVPAATSSGTTGTPPKAIAPIPNVQLAADAPIPGTGLALWLTGDDAMKSAVAGKMASWTNPLVPNVSAWATETKNQPSVAANAVNGHAAVRFDGVENMLKTNINISPDSWPDVTVFAVFSSATEATDLRKLYGDDNGGYDRVAGLDSRGGEGKNYVVFCGDHGVKGYFALKANQLYLTTDQFTTTEFSGWLNGTPTLTKVDVKYGDALPNMYIGGTGTVYNEFWKGDISEMIVYARVLPDAERSRVEDYLAKKYGIAPGR
jgi:hypothetical protein